MLEKALCGDSSSQPIKHLYFSHVNSGRNFWSAAKRCKLQAEQWSRSSILKSEIAWKILDKFLPNLAKWRISHCRIYWVQKDSTMSGTQPQRVRRMASPSTKQGPMKATVVFGLSPSGSRITGRKNSPSSSPTPQWGQDSHRKRRSPDHRMSPDRPISPAFKGIFNSQLNFTSICRPLAPNIRSFAI